MKRSDARKDGATIPNTRAGKLREYETKNCSEPSYEQAWLRAEWITERFTPASSIIRIGSESNMFDRERNASLEGSIRCPSKRYIKEASGTSKLGY